MIKKLERSQGNVYGMEVEGQINLQQLREIEPELDKLFQEYDKVNFLVLIKEFSGYGLKEMVADTRWALKHWSDIGKIAVVGDKKWEEIGVKLDNLVAKWEEKFFHISEIDQAWAWLEE